jgi:hypothetical protein
VSLLATKETFGYDGIMMLNSDHQKLHNDGWNQAWDEFFKKHDATGKPPTKAEIQDHHDALMKDSRFKPTLDKGVPAKHGFHDWSDKATKFRQKALRKLERKITRKCARSTCSNAPVVGQAVSVLASVWFFVEAVEDEGFFGAVGETVVGAIPIVGTVDAGLTAANMAGMVEGSLWDAVKGGEI